MIPRRQVLGGGLMGGVLGALAAPGVEAAEAAAAEAQRSRSGDSVDVGQIVRALNDLRTELRNQRQFSEIAAVREAQQMFLRSNGKLPDFIEVGSDVWFAAYDWHIRWQQPPNISRDPTGRLTFVRAAVEVRVLRRAAVERRGERLRGDRGDVQRSAISSHRERLNEADGRFRAGQLSAGRYQVEFSMIARVTETMEVNVEAGQIVTLPRLVLRRGVRLTAQLMDAATGEPIPNPQAFRESIGRESSRRTTLEVPAVRAGPALGGEVALEIALAFGEIGRIDEGLHALGAIRLDDPQLVAAARGIPGFVSKVLPAALKPPEHTAS
jgi:hypothetical protein